MTFSLLRSAWQYCRIAATIVKMRKVAFDLPKLGKLPLIRLTPDQDGASLVLKSDNLFSS